MTPANNGCSIYFTSIFGYGTLEATRLKSSIAQSSVQQPATYLVECTNYVKRLQRELAATPASTDRLPANLLRLALSPTATTMRQ